MADENNISDSIGAGITGQDANEPSRKQQLWLKRIKEEQKAHQDFRDRAKEVAEVYRKQADTVELYVPLFWQVVSIEHTGCFSNQPVPDVRPRNDANQKTYRDVARCIQRGLGFCVDQPSFDENFHRVVDDYLAIGIGVPRVKLESMITKRTEEQPIMSQQVVGYDQFGAPMMQEVQTGTEKIEIEEVGDQSINWEFVPWMNFGWEECNNFKNCDFIYIKHPMTRREIKRRFGKMVAAKSDTSSTKTEGQKTYDIYEVWDRVKREVHFIAEGEADILETVDDPLELKDFYPIPTPMMMNLPSDKLIPQSDYDYIEPYDVEINRLQERRMGLLDQIRASGAYDSGLPELKDMFENEDGEYTPIANLMQRLSTMGGIENVLTHLPIKDKALVLGQLTDQIKFIRAQVDEVLGISDIVRGVTAASETATAQEIKGRWVGVRLTRKRETVQYCIREMMRIMAQLLGSHITPQNLQRMTQMQITDEMLQIMQDDVLMEFTIDIETDSTVAKDEAREMETKQEMLNGVAQYAQSVLPMVKENQMPASVASAILAAALKPYTRYDRQLEEEMGNLPTTMSQLQKLSTDLQQAQGQLQQAQQQAQQWQMVAEQLQQQATAASAKQKEADAGKKQAETASIMAKLPADKMKPIEVDAGIELTSAQTFESLARAKNLNRPDVGKFG
jgi:hypothetical protein